MEDDILTANGLGRRIRRKNRSRLEIVASMLGIAEQGVKKTQLMYQGNLSFELLHKYLDSLLKAALIERLQEKNQFIYKTTAKGLQFIKNYQDLQKHATELNSKKIELEKLFR